jgi:hypothetical protein
VCVIDTNVDDLSKDVILNQLLNFEHYYGIQVFNKNLEKKKWLVFGGELREIHKYARTHTYAHTHTHIRTHTHTHTHTEALIMNKTTEASFHDTLYFFPDQQ